jgi:hypothetical protein
MGAAKLPSNKKELEAENMDTLFVELITPS